MAVCRSDLRLFLYAGQCIAYGLPFQDTNDFSLDYIGVIFANYNYTETSVLLDISDCTLIDGKGEEHEITELEGSHILFFDEENWQWNLMTTQNHDYVDDFKDIYGGRLVVDAPSLLP